MRTPIRVLVVEDSEDDTLLVIRQLESGGYSPMVERVETPDEMTAALVKKTWDIVLADYNMPHFSAPEALKLLKESGLDLPFIVVSGSIGEETAVASMKAGAQDYVMKDNLKRLAPAVKRELLEAEVRCERRRVEEALHQSEEKYSTLVERGNDGIIIIQDGVLTFANQRMIEMTGFSLEETLGKSFVDFVSPDYRELVVGRYRKRMSGGEVPSKYEIEIIGKNGGKISVEISASIIENNGGAADMAIVRDITERKQAEESLRESEQSLKEAQRIAHVGNWDWDIVGGKLYWSDEIYRIFGLEPQQFDATYEAFLNSIRPDHREFVRKSVDEALYENKPYSIDHSIVLPDGSERVVHQQATVTFNGSGKPIRMIGAVQDITERRKIEERLIITDRLASVGELSSGIAHELNNPLTSVIGFSQLLLDKDVSDDVKEDIKIIYDESQRAAGIVKGLLTFARKHTPARQLVNINSIIEKVLELRAYEQKVSNIQVNTRFATDLPEIMVDHFQLLQAFLNIIINAEHFMTEAHNRGSLSITTERTDGIIRASFADDGSGIAKENLGRLFDPFFTTKKVGQGTGLGLSICHGIVSEHDGRIYAESELGKGATFVVELPIVTEAKEMQLPEPPVDEIQKAAKAEILVVDDEVAIRQFLNRILTNEGHEVETVGNASDALEKLESRSYGLILLDIKMPGMSGIELYEHIQSMNHSLASRVLFITGDVTGVGIKDFLSRTQAPYITKPLNIEKLRKAISRILIKST